MGKQSGAYFSYLKGSVSRPAYLAISLAVVSIILTSVAYVTSSRDLLKSATAAPTTFVVDSTADTADSNPGNGVCADAAGDCSLRAAIEEANANTGADTINFDVPSSDANHYCYKDNGSAGTVSLANEEVTTTVDDCSSGATTDPDHPYSWFKFSHASNLTVNDQVFINGYSQAGSQANTTVSPAATDAVLKIQVTGDNHGVPASGILINITTGSDGSELRGINLANGPARYGAYAGYTSGVTVAGNYFGIDISGLVDYSSNIYAYGGFSLDSDDITFGGPNPEDRNVADGLYAGIYYRRKATNGLISGNYLGVDKTGNSSIGVRFGVLLYEGSNGNVVGGTTANERNVISGATSYGVIVHYKGGSHNNHIKGNYIGTNAAGTAGIGSSIGVTVLGNSGGTFIGTDGDGVDDALEGNLISGSINNGISIGQSSNTTVAGNYIGTDVTGNSAIPNNRGLGISNLANNMVVGTNGDGTSDDLEGNVISGNIERGITINGTGGADDVVVAGNKVGTNAAGSAALGNGSHGMTISSGGADNNIIGTNGDGVSDDLEGNIFSGNSGAGMVIGSGSQGNIIAGNKVGTDITGAVDLGNTIGGIYLLSSDGGNRIGTDGNGTSDNHERNIISGNDAYGLLLSGSDNNKISGNYIGTDSAGTADLGNSTEGISVTATSSNNQIGTNGDGTGDIAERNIISGNNARGVHLTNDNTDNNVVAGNYIGTDVSGTAPLGNGNVGVYIIDGPNSNIIGVDGDGSAGEANEKNVISANNNSGVFITGTSTDNNVVAGNHVGTNAAGTAALGNTSSGVVVTTRATGNLIGTNSDGTSDTLERNVISGNSGSGVYGVVVYSDNNDVYGNYVGTDVAGTSAIPNGHGVVLGANSSTNIHIGGPAASQRNIISGNSGYGINTFGPGSFIQNNYIGTDVSGSSDLGNSSHGIYLNGGNGTIVGTDSDGTTDSQERNVISGNDGNGIAIRGVNAAGNVIAGNYIGTDQGGAVAVENTVHGIYLYEGASSNQIGTDADGTEDTAERNVISGNRQFGIYIHGAGSDSNKVAGNYIGTQADGSTALGNVGYGVVVAADATDNVIGNVDSTKANIIANNGNNGVLLNANALNNPVLSNSIYANTNIGIDIFDGEGNEVDTNDTGDTDTGANDALNYPIITNSSSIATANPAIDVYLDVDVSETTSFLVQLYDNPNGLDTSGHGEGEVFIGSVPVTGVTAGGMNTTLNFTGTISDPANISLTITEDLGAGNYGSTSEFSPVSIQYIEGRIFEDIANNSSDDTQSVDPGYSGVTVNIYNDDGDDTFDATSDRLVYQTTTSSSGGYSAPLSSAGDFWVQITDTALVIPTTSTSTGPEKEASDSSTTGHWAVASSQTVQDVSFGYFDSAADSDGDGLTNAQEATLGTNHLDADTDDDGISDGVEDANQNGTLDSTETDPTNPDTDSDGLTDGLELGNTAPVADPDGSGPMLGTDTTSTNYKVDADPSTTTSPLLTDTDTDTLDDSTEDLNKDGKVDQTETDPNKVDTDADTINDNLDLCPLDPTNNCDGDNIPTTIEDAGPNSGDSNSDGTKDSEQPEVASSPNPNANDGYTALTLDTSSTDSCDSVSNLGFVAEGALPVQDSLVDLEYDYPIGLFDFRVACENTGDTAAVTYILDQEYETSDWEWRKFNPTTQIYSNMQDRVTYSTVTIAGTTKTTATFSVTDGQTLDDDAQANATILDPSGPAVATPTLPELEIEEDKEEDKEDVAELEETGSAGVLVSLGLAVALIAVSGVALSKTAKRSVYKNY